MGSGKSSTYTPFSYKNWSTFNINLREIPFKFSEIDSDLLQRNDLILTCDFCKENQIKIIATEKYENQFMCNYCVVQKGIEQTADIFK